MSSWVALLERSSSGSTRLVLLVLGPITAIASYGCIVSRYRNTDKSYRFEETIRIEFQDVQGSDIYLKSIGCMQEKHVEDHEYPKEPRDRLRMW